MKPLYLELCGINSFSEPAEIDFTRLLEFGIFGIFGDTGSGKSTILDCIGFALYGNVTRSRTGSMSEIVNERCEKAYVRFEFEIMFEGRRRRFRVERELKRKNSLQSVKVFEREGEALHALCDGVRESNALLERIIGLEQKDFEKCIALPQGEFAQFVRAQRSDRLKLVSRLFDLEAYGEALVKRANANFAAARTECDLIDARLEPYAQISAEANARLLAEIGQCEEENAGAKRALESAREEEKRLTALVLRREEAESVGARLSALREREGEISELERELVRLERASSVLRTAEEAKTAEETAARAKSALVAAQAQSEEAEKRWKDCSAWDEERADEQIALLTERRARAQQAEEAARKIAVLGKELNAARSEYHAESEKFRDFSYEEEKAAIESRLNKLGEGDFAAFVEERGKAALFRGEYAQFAGELTSLGEKYPVAKPDTDPLAEKYRALSGGEEIDFSRLRAEYEARERTRRAEQANLLDLERRNGLFRAHRERLMQLQTEGVRLKEELAEWQSRAGDGEMSLADVDRELSAKRKEKKEFLAIRERARSDREAANAAYAAACEKLRAAGESAERADKRLKDELERSGFPDAEAAAALLVRFGSPERAKEETAKYREEFAGLAARARELGKDDLSAGTREALGQAKERLAAAETEYETGVRTLALKKDEYHRGEEALEKKRAIEKERAAAARRLELAERLKKLLEGNKFMEFVAEEYLVNVAENAGARLLSLTSGRYFLRYEGGFLVGDNLCGGKTRGVYTLSGGETFLVSLSLALALSAEICAKSLRPIEFFFLDEGFGTLDERLVDTVMDSLEKLRNEHFSIGIISHVEELKHRIERKLLVEKANEKRGSRISVN